MPAQPASRFNRVVVAHLRTLAGESPAAAADPFAHYRGLVGRYFLTAMPSGVAVQSARIRADLPGEWLIPDGASSDRRLLFLHGGGYAAGSLDSHRALVARIAQAAHVVAFNLDYRLAPEWPFPAALSDALCAYDWVERNGPPGAGNAVSMFVAGDSAGGGLTLALLLRLVELGRRPANAAAVLSAWTDLTLSGESIESLANPELGATREAVSGLVQAYAAGRDLTDPLISPLFGAGSAFPPLMLHVSGAEFLFDDTWRFADRCARAGNAVVVRAQPDMVHVWQGFAPQLPEASAAIDEIGVFFRTLADEHRQGRGRITPETGDELDPPGRSSVGTEALDRTLGQKAIRRNEVWSDHRDDVADRIGSLQIADGLTLRYRHYPHPDVSAPTLLCLAGLTRNSKDFVAVAERYNGVYHVICPDFRGRGLSDYDLDYRRYRPETYCNDVFAILDQLAVPRVTVLGTSLGGLVAMLMAQQRPHAVAAVVLNDVGAEIAPSGLARILRYVGLQPPTATWDDAVAQARSAYEIALPDLSDDEWRRFTVRAYRQCDDGTIRADMDPRIGRAIRMPSTAPRDPWADFRSLTHVPTLLLRGALSDILAETTVEKMRAVKPDLSCMTVPRRGHAPLLDEPACVEALDGFLRV